MVVVLVLAADVDQAVDRARAAQRLAARPVDAAPVHVRVGVGLEAPVVARAPHRLAVADRQVDPSERSRRAGFEQQHARRAGLRSGARPARSRPSPRRPRCSRTHRSSANRLLEKNHCRARVARTFERRSGGSTLVERRHAGAVPQAFAMHARTNSSAAPRNGRSRGDTIDKARVIFGRRVCISTSQPSASASATAWRDRQPTPTPAATTRLMASLLPSSRAICGSAEVVESQRSLASRVPEPGSRRTHAAAARSAMPACRPASGCDGAANDHQLVVEPAAHGQVGVALAALDEADVDVEGGHRRDHLAGVADRSAAHVAAGGPLPAPPGSWQQVFADREAGGDAQRREPLAREPRLQVARLLEQRHRHRQQGAAVLVEHQPAADAVEQRGAEAASSSAASAVLAADCERATRSAAARVEPARAVATKTSSWRRVRRSR